MEILVVDNYDSFVFNLVQYLGQLGVTAQVWRNDDERLTGEAAVTRVAEEFDGVLLSPGPGTPERAGASIALVRACAQTETPLLGIVALRMLGQKLEWDAEKMCFPDCSEANKYVNLPYREGWKL